MSLVNFVACAVVVYLLNVGEASAHGSHHGRGHGYVGHRGHHHRYGQHRHHHNCDSIQATFNIYDPKGLEVYVMRPNDSAQYFAIEININNQNGGRPDLSLKTTKVVYGKYILTDTAVVIKAGDNLNYNWSIGFRDGTVVQKRLVLNVNSSMISKNCSCEEANVQGSTPRTTLHTTTHTPTSSIPPWSRTTTTFRPSRVPTTGRVTAGPNIRDVEDQSYDDYNDLYDCEIDPTTNLCRSALIDPRIQPQKLVSRKNRDDEMRALKGIIHSLSQQCSKKPKSNFLTLVSPGYPFPDSTELLNYVRLTLSVSPKLKELANRAVIKARPNGSVIVFELKTLLDKLMILYLSHEAGATTVQDYD